MRTDDPLKIRGLNTGVVLYDLGINSIMFLHKIAEITKTY